MPDMDNWDDTRFTRHVGNTGKGQRYYIKIRFVFASGTTVFKSMEVQIDDNGVISATNLNQNRALPYGANIKYIEIYTAKRGGGKSRSQTKKTRRRAIKPRRRVIKPRRQTMKKRQQTMKKRRRNIKSHRKTKLRK